MKTLLVMTIGQSDVQIVVDGIRHELATKDCGPLQDEIVKRGYTLVNVPAGNKGVRKEALPEGALTLCTPKLDAVLASFDGTIPAQALLFDTRRVLSDDPRHAGAILERRLRERGVTDVTRHALLTEKERLEDYANPEDAVVRRAVVSGVTEAIAQAVANAKPDRVILATTGGLSAANEVVAELTRLHATGREVVALEVPDSTKGGDPAAIDRAVAEKFHPAAGYRARWHALSLVVKGNLLGAWGAVSHLENAPGQEWTQVIKWLANFASSLPLPPSCDLAVLSHRRMAVRAALRVELALRAGDIPRAVHGTVAFFETALWDHLSERTSRHPTKRQYSFNLPPPPDLVREQDETKRAALSKNKRKENDNRPFIPDEMLNETQWYWIDDKEVPATKLAERYVKLDGLTKLAKVVDREIRNLRNDASHNEPTPALMNGARAHMQAASLWSTTDTFLSQPLVQAVLKELGEATPESLLVDLLTEVRRRLLSPVSIAGSTK